MKSSLSTFLRRIRGGSVGLCAILALLGLTDSHVARAQDNPPAPPVTTPETTPAAPEKESTPRLLYIPFKDLAAALKDVNSSVMVPLAEYLKLTQAAAGTVVPADAAVITSATYTATVEKDLAQIHAVLQINAIGKPWIEIPISFGDAAIGKITSADNTVLMKGKPDGTSALLVKTAGEHAVKLDLVAKVHVLPDGRQLAMTIPPVAVTSFELTIPEADQTVEIQPRQAMQPVGEDMMQTHLKATIGSSTVITAKWYPRASKKPEMELLASAANEQIVSVDEGLLHRDAWLRYEILRGQVTELRLVAPKGSRVLDVSGDAKIRGWKTVEEAKRQVITVELLTATDQPVQIEVHTESPLPEGAFTVAGVAADGEAFGVHAIDVVRESGQVSVRAADGLALTMTDQQGITRVDASQTKERLRSDRFSAFQYFSPQFVLKAEAKTIEPRLVVTHQAQLVFLDDELRLVSDLNYTIERAGVFELRLKLPENVTVDDVQCPTMKEFRVDDASRTLIITLAQKTVGGTTVAIRAHRPFSAATDMAEQAVPIVEPLNVDRETGTVLIFARESIDVVTPETGIVAAQPYAAPPGLMYGDARLSSSWTFTHRPVTIPIKTVRKPARLSADIATTIDVQPQITSVVSQVTFHAEYAGLDTFKLLVPEAASPRLRIESADSNQPIRQQTPAAAENGWVPWTIVMQREILGSLRLNVTYDLRSGNADAAAAAPAEGPLTIRVIRAAGTKAIGDVDVPLTRVTGQIAITRNEALAVTANATGGDVEPIDVRELTLLPQQGASAFRYFRQPDANGIEITLTRARHEVQPVIATVVERGLVEVVAGDAADAAATFRCRFRIKTSERQRLLLQLPVNLELLGAYLNGRDVPLEKADIPSGQLEGESWAPYWLNVSREGSDDQTFTVTLQFLWKLNPSLRGTSYGRGGLELPLPLIGTKNNPAAEQELRVAVWVPKDLLLVGESKDFTLVHGPKMSLRFLADPFRAGDPNLDAWFGDNSNAGSALPKEGRLPYVYSNVAGAVRLRVDWWRRVWATAIASGALALIALVLVKTSWENKIGMLLLGGLVMAIYALSDRQSAMELIVAGRFGLLFLAGLWLVHGLLGARPKSRPIAAPPASPPPPPSPPPHTGTIAPVGP